MSFGTVLFLATLTFFFWSLFRLYKTNQLLRKSKKLREELDELSELHTSGSISSEEVLVRMAKIDREYNKLWSKK